MLLNAAQEQAGIDQTQSGFMANLGQYRAGLAERTGAGVSAARSRIAELSRQTGMTEAQIAQVVGSGQAANILGLGEAEAQYLAGAASDIAGLTQEGAATGLQSEQNVGSMLATLATQTGTPVAGLQTQQGTALAAGQLGAGTAQAQNIANISAIGAQAIGQLGGLQTPTAPPPPTSNAPGGNPYLYPTVPNQ